MTGHVAMAVLAACTGVVAAISVNSGNTTTDHVTGDNQFDVPLTGAALPGALSFSYILTLDAATTVYLKAKTAVAVGNVLTGKLLAESFD